MWNNQKIKGFCAKRGKGYKLTYEHDSEKETIIATKITYPKHTDMSYYYQTKYVVSSVNTSQFCDAYIECFNHGIDGRGKNSNQRWMARQGYLSLPSFASLKNMILFLNFQDYEKIIKTITDIISIISDACDYKEGE